jgi:hypothetical protein
MDWQVRLAANLTEERRSMGEQLGRRGLESRRLHLTPRAFRHFHHAAGRRPHEGDDRVVATAAPATHPR